MVKHLGEWKRDSCGRTIFEEKEKPASSPVRWTTATNKSWDSAVKTLKDARLGWFCHSEEDLSTPREERRREAENRIRVLAQLLKLPSSVPAVGDRWASDGSMLPASAGILDDKTVTAALTGPTTMVMKLNGRNCNILHGEVLCLIMGHILCNPEGDNLLYTDHLNSVRFLQDTHMNINQEKNLRYRNGRSYLKWLSLLSKESNLQVNYKGTLHCRHD
jgi:hypothetical protein